MELTLSQKQALLLRLPSTVRSILIDSSRGTGKTRGVASFLCIKMTIDPMISLWLRRTYAALEDIREQFRVLAPIFSLEVQERKIIFPNGSIIHLGQAREINDCLKYQGYNVDGYLVIDEAAQISYDIIVRLLATVRSTKRTPLVIYITNPSGGNGVWLKRQYVDPTNDIDAIIRDGVEGSTTPSYWVWEDKARIFMTLDDNPFYTAEQKQDYINNLDKLPPGLREQWLMGDWSVVAGQWLPNLVDYLDTMSLTPKKYTEWSTRTQNLEVGYTHPIFYIGLDPGYSCPTAILFAAWFNQKLYIFDELVIQHSDVDTIASAIQAKMRDYNIQTFTGFIDPSSNQHTSAVKYTIRELYAAKGLFFTPANNNRLTGHMAMRSWFSSGAIVINPKCTTLISQLQSLETDPKNPELTVDTLWSDAVDAFRYLCVSTLPMLTSIQNKETTQ